MNINRTQSNKKDIADRKDIELLMNTFYERLLKDDSINYIFTDVVKIDIKTHIAVITEKLLKKHFLMNP